MKRIAFLLLGLISLFAFADEPQWIREGPNIETIVSIVPDRSHPQIWFAIEAPQGRLYRSIDNGKSWQYTNQKDDRVNSICYRSQNWLHLTIKALGFNFRD